MDDRTEHQVIRDLLWQILGELKVANEIAKLSIAHSVNSVTQVKRIESLNEKIKDIRMEHQP